MTTVLRTTRALTSWITGRSTLEEYETVLPRGDREVPASVTLPRWAAEVLGIPYDEVTQVALIPTAYYTGSSFSPSLRKPVDEVLHIDAW